MKKCDLVFHYHDQTKHDYYRYAASLGHLDWDNQPDPFRRYIGSRLISLPLIEVHPSLEYDQLYSQKIQAHPVSCRNHFSTFFLLISSFCMETIPRYLMGTSCESIQRKSSPNRRISCH